MSEDEYLKGITEFIRSHMVNNKISMKKLAEGIKQEYSMLTRYFKLEYKPKRVLIDNILKYLELALYTIFKDKMTDIDAVVDIAELSGHKVSSILGDRVVLCDKSLLDAEKQLLQISIDNTNKVIGLITDRYRGGMD